MGEEQIRVPLMVDSSFWDDLERNFDRVTRHAAQRMSQALRGQGGLAGGGGGGSAPGGGAFGGGGTAQVGGVAGAFGNAGAAIFNGVGQGFLATPTSSVMSPAVLAQNAEIGAANAGVGLLKMGLTAGGAALGTALGGPALGAVTAAAGGAIGDLIQAQFNSVKDAMEVPTDRAAARIKSIYGNLAAAGVETTEEGIKQAAAFQIEVERMRYNGEQRADRITRELAARDSLAQGLNFAGR